MSERILVAGETLIDFIPEGTGSLSSVETFTRRPGGAPANVAVGLARLGETPLFWTRVGADPFGDVLVDTLSSEGLPGRFVERDSEARTTLAFVAHGPDGETEFSFYRDDTADTRLQVGTVPDDVLSRMSAVYVGGVPLASEPSRSAVLDLARRAREAGPTIWFDPNARPELWTGGEFPDLVDRALGLSDVVKATPGDLRAAGFEAESPDDLARAVCERGPHTALLTLGAEGALVYATDRADRGPATIRHPGYRIEPVDATGAGDAFTAGTLAATVGGDHDLEAVLGFANAVAALTTTATGAMTALPDRATARSFRAERSE